jgi:Transposase DDE domain group 1
LTTALLDLSSWPVGARVLCRRERAHPGAQLTFTDKDGHRFQVLLTDTHGTGNDIAALELRHRQHARVEDRIRTAKDRSMRNLPCQDLHTNRAWLELALTAADLSTWAQALCFTGELRKVEPKRLRYRVLHIAGRLIRTGRRLILRLDQNWPWAKALARAFTRLREAPWPA